MVLQVVYTAVSSVLPPRYWPHAAVVAAVLFVIYAYTQGRSTTRERDLHARVILLTVSPNVCYTYDRPENWREAWTNWGKRRNYCQCLESRLLRADSQLSLPLE